MKPGYCQASFVRRVRDSNHCHKSSFNAFYKLRFCAVSLWSRCTENLRFRYFYIFLIYSLSVVQLCCSES